MPKRRITIVEAPSSLGLATDGVEMLPERLRALGLAEQIDADRSIRLQAPVKSGVLDPRTRVLNAPEIAAWSPQLANAVASVIDDGGFPLVLGGDCTILLGSMLALRRRGRYGLLFIDGNADFFQPEAEPEGEGASMDLAFVTGYGPSLVADLEGLRPLVRPADAVARLSRSRGSARVRQPTVAGRTSRIRHSSRTASRRRTGCSHGRGSPDTARLGRLFRSSRRRRAR